MRFIANLMDPDVAVSEWARAREVEGWSSLAASDHYFLGGGGTGRWFPHVWVTASQMAAATERPTIMTTFANNLVRSPVEFVQAALTLQAASGGRFVAGLGAGWNRAELETTGQRYPPRRERADRYIEAVQIVRQLFDRRGCVFGGDHYTIDLPSMTGFGQVAPPPLVGSLGGPRTIAGAAPFLDGVELKAASPAFRDGDMDFGVLAAIPASHLVDLVDRVRRVRDDVPIGFMAVCGPGTDGMARAMERLFEADSLHGGFFGHPEKVAETMHNLSRHGISHVQVSPTTPDAFETLAPYLFPRA